jgi:hypothetical protein
MENPRLIKFVEELRQQCRFGLIAWQGLHTSLNGMDNERVFFYVHALLDHSRRVAGFLWSENEALSETSAALREGLKVPESSDLKHPDLEHFAGANETQFDRWLNSLSHLHFLPMNVMPQGTMAEFQQDAFLRNLDPDLYVFHWYNRSIDLGQLVNALRQIDSLAESWLRRH